MSQLPNLQRLDLSASDMAGACFSAASLGALSALGGSLTRLRTEEAAVPPSLSTLTRLLHLELDEWQGGSAGIDSVLQSLTQLTCLVRTSTSVHQAGGRVRSLRVCSWLAARVATVSWLAGREGRRTP